MIDGSELRMGELFKGPDRGQFCGTIPACARMEMSNYDNMIHDRQSSCLNPNLPNTKQE
jgi:hypothetical protein